MHNIMPLVYDTIHTLVLFHMMLVLEYAYMIYAFSLYELVCMYEPYTINYRRDSVHDV
jgi:hypothetical protein